MMMMMMMMMMIMHVAQISDGAQNDEY